MKTLLYAITDSDLLPDQMLFDGVSAALEGGCRLVPYRDKSSDKSRRFADAEQLLQLCHQYDAKLIINDDIELAKSIQADGVHLGQDDGSPSRARDFLGADFIIGVTCHDSLMLAQQALAGSANYIAFGRFFPSKTKPLAPPAPLELLREARKVAGEIPIVAIGGITLENAASVLAAGADLIAVSHSLFGAPDIAEQARKFNQLR